jgi:hypothetical protein
VSQLTDRPLDSPVRPSRPQKDKPHRGANTLLKALRRDLPSSEDQRHEITNLSAMAVSWIPASDYRSHFYAAQRSRFSRGAS